MKLLLVGAGAVGQVYGLHLERGGAEVTFLVRPEYAEKARKGFDLYPLNRKDPRREPVRFERFRVVTSPDEVSRDRYDAVILCVSSPALRKGRWLEELAAKTPDSTIVSLQPGIEDRAFLVEHIPESRLVAGLIGLQSYEAPLPGEIVPRPGTAYWLPPLSDTPFSGPPERTQAIVDAFRRGGLRSKVHRDVPGALAFGGAVFETHVAALECAHWSFRELARGDLLGLARRASKEALEVASMRLGRRPPLLARLVRPLSVRLALRLLPLAAPFDMEVFFRVHFTKVGDQTRLMLKTYAEIAARSGLETSALLELASRLERASIPS